MSIPAQRFNFLNQETNVATTDFLKANSRAILNSPNNVVKLLTSEVEGFLTTATQNLLPNDLLAGIDSTVREVKGAVGAAKDIAAMAIQDIDAAVGALSVIASDVNQVRALLTSLADPCKSKAARSRMLGRPYLPNIDCNGNKRRSGHGSCGPSAIPLGNVLNKISGGAFNAAFRDINSILNAILALSKLGYGLNMCGVFTALTKGALGLGGISNDMMSRVAAGVISDLASDNNTFGLLDMASGAAGLGVNSVLPGTTNMISQAIAIPDGITENQQSDLASRTLGAMESFDPEYNSSSYDGMMSMSKMTNSSPDMKTLMNSAAMDNIYDSNNLDTAPSNDATFTAAAIEPPDNGSFRDPLNWNGLGYG